MIRTLLIDNYDSFTLNLFHLLAEVNGRPPVLVPNDWCGWRPSVLDEFDNVVLSPGPGTPVEPADFGICAEGVASSHIPVLGICLGHQGIAAAGSARISHAPEPRHGRVSAISHTGEGLFAGLPSPFNAVRYHSLAVTEVAHPLVVTARSADGVVQGIARTDRPQWGVQFHPESILTDHGAALLENFVRLTREYQGSGAASAALGAEPGVSAPGAESEVEPESEPEVISSSSAAGLSATGPSVAGPSVDAPSVAGRDRPSVSTSSLLTRSVPFTGHPADLFAALHGGDACAVWLDGNLPGDDRGRFSIMGAPTGPWGRIAEADVHAGTVTVTGPGAGTGTGSGTAAGSGAGSVTGTGSVNGSDASVVVSSFFDWLDAELRRHRLPPDATAHLPFDFGLGWVGYLGYELKAECGASSLHRASTPDATLVFLDRALVLDAQEGTAHLLALDPTTHPGEAEVWLEAASAVVTDVDRLPQDEGDVESSEPLQAPQSSGGAESSAVSDGSAPPRTATAPSLTARVERDDYIERVRAAQRLIRDGETYEVCLTTQFDGPVDALAPGPFPLVTAADPLVDVYLRLRRDNPAPFGAYLRLPHATVLSTSPERFLRIDSTGRVESSPIKGTRPRGRTAAEDAALIDDLSTSEKDRSENLMIVDLVRHDLGRTARTGSVQVETLFGVESYASVHQLVSTVTAQLEDGASAVECVRAAFPPGSMTGAPKLRTMEILDSLEAGPRGVYSGAIGWFSLTGAADLSVVIRTLVAADGRFSYGVGGAVVALSDAVDEYDETIVKAGPLLRLLKREDS